MTYSIRYMKEDDIPQVTEIDREAFPTQWPYPAYAYKRELNNRLASYLVCIESGSAWKDGRNRSGGILKPFLDLFRQPKLEKPPSPGAYECIAGFAGIWRMLDEAHLTTIAVRQSRRRRGIGERLLIAVIDMALEFNASVVTLEVRVSNHGAQALYRKYLFKDAGIRKGYYSEDGEDALIMTTENIATESYRATFKRLKEQHERAMSGRASPAVPGAPAG
ncbi:MAG: ribosomal protein S18-alanine N-acetyltransferase [Chloroflexi bacterium]|nr:ribosomal protein S18-alanine N-acetyltransferase [Chloroflexota bacterium]